MIEFTHVRDFYVLLAIEHMAKQHPFSHAWDKLLDDATYHVIDLASNLAPAMSDYLTLAAFGEVRHSFRINMVRYVPDLPLFSAAPGREDVMHIATMYDPRLVLPKIAWVFSKECWTTSSGIGGVRWEAIAKGALAYHREFRDKPIAFVDYCVDLEHNNATAFSKVEASSVSGAALHHFAGPVGWNNVKGFLEFKAHANPEFLVCTTPVALSTTSRLASKCAALLNLPYVAPAYSYVNASKYEYTPVEWGNEDIQLIERTPTYSIQDHYVTRTVGLPDVLKGVKEPDDLWATSYVPASKASVSYERRMVYAGKKAIAPLLEKYPKYRASIQALLRTEVDSYIRSVKMKKAQEFYLPNPDVILKRLKAHAEKQLKNAKTKREFRTALTRISTEARALTKPKTDIPWILINAGFYQAPSPEYMFKAAYSYATEVLFNESDEDYISESLDGMNKLAQRIIPLGYTLKGNLRSEKVREKILWQSREELRTLSYTIRFNSRLRNHLASIMDKQIMDAWGTGKAKKPVAKEVKPKPKPVRATTKFVTAQVAQPLEFVEAVNVYTNLTNPTTTS